MSNLDKNIACGADRRRKREKIRILAKKIDFLLQKMLKNFTENRLGEGACPLLPPWVRQEIIRGDTIYAHYHYKDKKRIWDAWETLVLRN